ncbi:MAG TPA: hypothetical protein VES88_12135 [Gemmatimonadaceae bacterium]|nr:hypothetical protein [Gemmatimonadaceae bacterium]
MWMRDILEHAVLSTDGLTLVEAIPGARALRGAVAQERPDVVITGMRDLEQPFGGFSPMLYEFPTLRIFAIDAAGRDTVQVTLIPSEESLGDVMLDSLMQLIADSARNEDVQPTRMVSGE